MRFKIIDLYEEFSLQKADGAAGELSMYLIDNTVAIDPTRKRPAVLVIPGGGYGNVSPREAEPVALKFLALGYQAFVLNYSVAPLKYPFQITEAALSMTFIRRNAAKFNVNPKAVAAIGFSAGGHLAGCLAVCFDDPAVKKLLGNDFVLARPDAVCLSYPVISSDEKISHQGSFKNLCGNDRALMEQLSLEKHVTSISSPAFIWHTADDAGVNVQNSLRLAAAYKENNAPFELHVFTSGPHGLSLGSIEVYKNNDNYNEQIVRWPEMLDTFLKSKGFKILE